MSMKSILKVLVAALAISATAFVSTATAQEKGKGKGAALTVERIEQAVGSLTADQKTKIEAVLAKAREAMKAAGQDADKRREGAAKQRADVRALLNAEQQKKFDDMSQGGKGGGKKN